MRPTMLLAALVLLMACRGEEAPEPAAGEGPPSTAAKALTYAEPEVVGILHAFDSSRIAHSLAVRDRSQSEAILEYARVVRIDHRAMRALLDSILGSLQQAPAENAYASQLRAGAEQSLTSLIALDSGFNNTYIRREADDHRHALALIDTVLLRSATTPAVKEALEKLRPAYAAHLQMAEDIRRAREAAARRRAAAQSLPIPLSVPDTGRRDTLTTTTGQ